jgi:phosphonoacetaldehyde hydrolase
VPRATTRIQLVIFDWAGTTIDHGSLAPLAPFIRAFGDRGVLITKEEARAPMGLHKKDHIRALLELPAVAERWRAQHGRSATHDDAEDLYARFMPFQLEVIDEFALLVPGLLSCGTGALPSAPALGTFKQRPRESIELPPPRGTCPTCASAPKRFLPGVRPPG